MYVLIAGPPNSSLDRVGATLRGLGVEVTVAERGEDALTSAFRRQPVLVVTALRFEDMDALTFLRIGGEILAAAKTIVAVPEVWAGDRDLLGEIRRLGLEAVVTDATEARALTVKLRELLPGSDVDSGTGLPTASLYDAQGFELASVAEVGPTSALLNTTTRSPVVGSGVRFRLRGVGDPPETLRFLGEVSATDFDESSGRGTATVTLTAMWPADAWRTARHVIEAHRAGPSLIEWEG